MNRVGAGGRKRIQMGETSKKRDGSVNNDGCWATPAIASFFIYRGVEQRSGGLMAEIMFEKGVSVGRFVTCHLVVRLRGRVTVIISIWNADEKGEMRRTKKINCP